MFYWGSTYEEASLKYKKCLGQNYSVWLSPQKEKKKEESLNILTHLKLSTKHQISLRLDPHFSPGQIWAATNRCGLLIPTYPFPLIT